MSIEEDLKPVREEIDAIDSKLIELLNKRMECAQQVGRIKAARGHALFDAGREELIYRKLAAASAGPLTEDSLRSIYREIFAASRMLQYVLRVAFPGPEWTCSYLASLSMFGHSAHYLPLDAPEEVFDSLLKGTAHVAVVPIENSLLGSVGSTMDLLFEREVRVVRECYLEVAHYCFSKADSLEKVKHLYVHPRGKEQCRRWILENLRHVEFHECPSTAGAARLAQEDPSGAAICDLYAGSHFGLNILAERIEDHAGNTTRFFALGNHPSSPTGSDKTSLLFSISHKPGTMHAAMEAFARSNVNMTRIESRPNRLFPWQYLFYVDIEGHEEEARVQKALADLKNQAVFLKVLGSYPKCDPMRPVRPEKEKLRSMDKVEQGRLNELIGATVSRPVSESRIER